jgi:hypothetical protein
MMYISDLNLFFERKAEIINICYQDKYNNFKRIRSADVNIRNPWNPYDCFHPTTHKKRIADFEAWNIVGDHLRDSQILDWKVNPILDKKDPRYTAFSSIISNNKDKDKDIYIKLQIKDNVQFTDHLGIQIFGISFHH